MSSDQSGPIDEAVLKILGAFTKQGERTMNMDFPPGAMFLLGVMLLTEIQTIRRELVEFKDQVRSDLVDVENAVKGFERCGP